MTGVLVGALVGLVLVAGRLLVAGPLVGGTRPEPARIDPRRRRPSPFCRPPTEPVRRLRPQAHPRIAGLTVYVATEGGPS